MSTDCSDQKENEPAIGDATMDDDYTIHIRMRRAGSAHVDGRISYKKGSQYYDQVLEHIGGLKPGEIKLVPPFPENFESGNK